MMYDTSNPCAWVLVLSGCVARVRTAHRVNLFMWLRLLFGLLLLLLRQLLLLLLLLLLPSILLTRRDDVSCHSLRCVLGNAMCVCIGLCVYAPRAESLEIPVEWRL